MATDFVKPISFMDVENIYDRLCGIVEDLDKHINLYGHKMSKREFERMSNTLVALQSTVNQMYVASHTGKDGNI